ncbi:MAG: IS66 family transposase [Lachnospiraceae bacterium]|nr:IS66 family transposase [Lachnospiraceae bacterium]
MCRKFTPDELNTMDHETKNDVICQMQERLDRLEHDYENLMEQIRLANQQRFGRQTEKLEDIAGQLSFFNEAEANCDESAPEPTIEAVVDTAMKSPRKAKKKGQREEDLKDFPQEEIPHDVPEEKLNETFGEGNWKSMPDEVFWQLRFEPARWIAEKHVVKVYVGTDGLHQDEFLRGDHPVTLFRGSIATPSLEAAIINSKYVNSNPLDRIARDFQTNGLNLSKQTMSNWTIWSAERYFLPVYELMKKRQLEAHVNQCDETTLEVIHDGRPAGSKSYMWVHLTGELSPVPTIIVYEYQKTRNSDHPKEYYKDFNGVLMTDGLEQYHKLARDLEGVTNANCFAHARRHFANAIKAIGKENQKAIRSSIAYKALVRIGAIYDLEGALKDLTPKARLKERQASIKPLVEEFFAWIREIQADQTVLPKGETAKGLNYCLNQEEYLKVFLTDGEVPIDDSASERALRNFTIGRKNWMTINTIRGAQASAVIYSLTETARANNLNVYYYLEHLLTELPPLIRKNGNIEESKLEPLMPWSKTLPADCYSKRRK